MNWRVILLALILMSGTAQAAHQFVFRVKTKAGTNVGGVSIRAKDIEAAKVKVKKRYPDCTILNVEQK